MLEDKIWVILPALGILTFLTLIGHRWYMNLAGLVYGAITGLAFYAFMTSDFISPAAAYYFDPAHGVNVFGIVVTWGGLYTYIAAMIGLVSGQSVRKNASLTLLLLGIVFLGVMLALSAVIAFGNSPAAPMWRGNFDTFLGVGIVFVLSMLPQFYWRLAGEPKTN